MNPEGILAIIFIFGGGTLFLLAVSPVGRALADRIRHGTHPSGLPETDPALLTELEQLRDQVAELEPMHDRVRELEERLECAERLLAQRRDQELLPKAEPHR